MGRSEQRGFYLTPEMHALKVDNPHFDFRDEFNAALQVGGVTESFKRRLFANFTAAVGEDVLRRGSFELQVYQNNGGGLVLTTADHEEFGDISWISLNGAKKRRAEGRAYERELSEVIGMRRLRRELFNSADGATFVLICPPGSAEDGYIGTSLTYIYQVEGEIGVGRRVHASFYKNALSLEGHKEFFKFASPVDSIDGFESRPEFFVMHPIETSEHPNMQTAEDVIFGIDRIAERGGEYIVPGIGIGSSLSPEAFRSYGPQIHESAAFLCEAMDEAMRLSPRGLDQAGLSDLEVAYSYARRAVKAFAQKGRLLRSSSIMDDYRRQLVFEAKRPTYGFDSDRLRDEFFSQAFQFQAHLVDRYGRTEAEVVGGHGCPPGMLSSIGVSIDGFRLSTYGEVSFGNGGDEESTVMNCVTCPFCKKIVDAIVTARTIKCPECKAEAKRQ